jgi:hypothetical protein
MPPPPAPPPLPRSMPPLPLDGAATARAPRHEPPPPPKRSRPPAPGVASAVAPGSLPPPPIRSRRPPNLPPSARVVTSAAPEIAEPIGAPDVTVAALSAPLPMPPRLVEAAAFSALSAPEPVAEAEAVTPIAPRPAPLMEKHLAHREDAGSTTEPIAEAPDREPLMVALSGAEPAFAALVHDPIFSAPPVSADASGAQPSFAPVADEEDHARVTDEEIVSAPMATERLFAQPIAAAALSAADAARRFNSAGSEMPVALTTPVPHVPKARGLNLPELWNQRAEWLPRAHHWSQKMQRAAPRALVVSAPFIALFGIWLGHSLVPRHRHAASTLVVSATVPSAPSTVAAARVEAAVAAPATPHAEAPAASAVLTSINDTPAPAALADPTELVHALARGLPALEALAEKFPGDAQVGIALASQQAQAQRYEAAVATVEQVHEVDPASAQNGRVMGILWRAAQSSASEQSFLCLRKLGGRGSDIAFDLATTPGVRDAVRARAKAELTNYLAFDASPDTRTATALLLAPDCSTRKALLDRAETDGGKRTLSMLQHFARGVGCGSNSEGACNACLMGSPALAHALAKLDSGGKP